MDFTPTEAQTEARDLAARIFGDLATHERLKTAGTGSDPELFKALCTAGLVGAVTELGLLGLVLLLEEQGRTTAQAPYAATCVYGLLAVASHGTPEQRERLLPGIEDGSVVVGGALPAQGGVRATEQQRGVRAAERQGAVRASGQDKASGQGELTGSVPVVPWLRDATHVLVADTDRRLWLAALGEGTGITPVELTAPWSAGRLTLDRAPAEPLGGPGTGAYADVLATARTAFAGLQAGVCAGSLARAVAHTNTREQFGRPLATRQAVQLRAADAHMDTEAIRVTAYEAAWRRDAGLPYATHALTAAWWASEAGQRVVHTGQHLHGGAGADLDHPVHRHFLWGRQLDAYLGSGAEVLQELGELIAHGE
ncbi:acyl-CoA dehydrogenase family protein [Streptomyces sp. Ag109_G2-15]|uniref:acyl-CoA dehydrogenase family protein n=1 Tax=Streptomyces sp. Ag109_G2-15 TaxID=1938850 RepID=UPI000BD34A41|nr:acyl-CoA dehydrogenase family protein [Streptomyces sp. Ag109_G2-15]SOD85307.1 Acyl-CoA dehydrogenase [Streptomyces sp. Ag109_G2-15]